ncbi:MAG: ParA family protein [Rubrivivax sp.]|nr:ParA family protein [Rubrivivax sp.]
MRRVVFNQKGGVGKSTITVNLAAIAAHQGRRVLVVDLDRQANATRYLLADEPPPEGTGTASFFEETLKFSVRESQPLGFITETGFERLHLMPASAALDELHGKLESRAKVYKLRRALESLAGDYEEVWIDTPPALNFYTRSALIAADSCLIPFDCDAFSRAALYELMQNVQELQADHNESLHVEGIVVNQYQSRASLPQRTVQELIDEGLPVLQPYLGSSVKVKESHEKAMPLIHLEPSHPLTQAYVQLYENLG